MRVKIGNAWHEVEQGKPICIEFGNDDRENVARMDPECTKLAYFHDDDTSTADQKLAWMKDEAEYPA